MKGRVFLLLLFSSLYAVEGRSQIQHTYLPQCTCPPYSIDTTVSVTMYVHGPRYSFVEGLPNVVVSIGGEKLNVRDRGFLTFTAPNTGRIPLKVDADFPYTSVTEVLHVPMESNATVWKILTMPLPTNIPVDASSAFSLNIPCFSRPEKMVMEFAENIFPVADVTVWMSVWTMAPGAPRIPAPGDSVLDSVSGDYCTIGRDGRKQSLFSMGVFSLQFTDANNQSVPVLAEGCKLRVGESTLLEISVTPTLYGLNKYTGFWEFNSNFVPLGNGMLEASVQMSPDVSDFNIGYRLDTCVMKVKIRGGRGRIVDVLFSQRFDGYRVPLYHASGTTSDNLCLPVCCCKPTNPTCRRSFPKLYGTLDAVNQGDLYFNFPTAEDNGFSDELNAALEYRGGGGLHSVIEAYTGPIYPSIEQCKAGELHFTVLT